MSYTHISQICIQNVPSTFSNCFQTSLHHDSLLSDPPLHLKLIIRTYSSAISENPRECPPIRNPQ